MRNNVVQLRELLREKFPGLRFAAEAAAEPAAATWPTGMAQIDGGLRGGLPRGAMTEVLCGGRSVGGALLIAGLLKRAAAANQIAVLIDGQDSFDPAAIAPEVRRHLLWVRCQEAEQALKAADVVLRDANLPFVILDLALNPAAQLRKVPATVWYRFQRLIEPAATTLVVVAPQRLVSGAAARLTLANTAVLADLDVSEEALLARLPLGIEDLRRSAGTMQRTAEAG